MYLFLGNLTTHTTILQDEDNSNPLVENGFCNDETNLEECIYDGGDCCGSDINTDHCLSEDYLLSSLVCYCGCLTF